MKEFLKWLGINEKVAKVCTIALIFMVIIIILNTFLESVGLPFYKITHQNLSNINTNIIVDALISWLIVLLSFYSTIFLVFRVKDFKKIFKYSLIFLALNILLKYLTRSSVAVQIFIFLYILGFCYLYANKNKKYILYGLLSYLLFVFVEFICYWYKLRFIDFNELNYITRNLLGLDCFVIMLIIIIIKEIILNKKGKQ